MCWRAPLRLIAASALLVPAALAGQGAGAVADTQTVAISGVTVIDVALGRRVPDQTVVVRGARIAAAGPRVGRGAVAVPAGARAVDGRGRYLMPGLWDMHWHEWDDSATRSILLPLELANGVTGVRLMWGMPEALGQRADVAAGRQVGPRLVVATPIIDGRMWPGSLAAPTPEVGRHLVDSLHALGYDFVKVYQFLPRDVFFAIAAEARRVGMPLAGHLPLGVTAAEASASGLRSFEHDMGVRLSCTPDERRIRAALVAAEAAAAPLAFPAHADLMTRAEQEALAAFDPGACAALAATLRRNDSWLVPTLVLYRGLGAAVGSPVRRDPRLRVLPAELRQGWATIKPSPAFDALRPRMAQLATLMAHAGAGILAGTDTGNPYVLPGFGLHDELALLVEGGLTPAEALRAATLNPARFLHATDSLGMVAPGKLADLVLLDADPLADIRNTTRVRAVVANGRFFDRAALDRLLRGAERAANPPATTPK